MSSRLSLRGAARIVVEFRESLTPQPSTAETPLSSVPCFEVFAKKLSESQALVKFEEDALVGDILLVKVKKFDAAGAYVKALCFVSRIKRDLEWLDIQLVAPLHPLSRRFSIGEYIHAEIIGVNPVKINLKEAPVAMNDAPIYFREGREADKCSLWKFVSKSRLYENPYIEGHLGLLTRSKTSLLDLEGSEQDKVETAAFLRRRQDKNLAMQNVAKGVAAMKDGLGLMSAVPLFNKALDIYPDCVDALVARGAAYANERKLENAEEDLEKALLLEVNAKNAKEYLSETLWIAAEMLETEGKIDEAVSKLEKSLKWNPNEERVKSKLEKLGRGKREQSIEICEIQEQKRRQSSDELENDRRKKAREDEELIERKLAREKIAEYQRFIKALQNQKKK